MLTRKQKKAIRQNWAYMRVQFRGEEVWAKKGECWGKLYSAEDTRRHLRAIGLL